MRYLALIILLGVTASLFGQNNSIALSQMKYAPAPNYAIITTTSGRQIYIEKDSFDIDTRLVAGWHSNDTLYLQVSRVSGQLPGPIDTIAVYIQAGGGGATYINAGSGISVTGAGTLANPFVISNTAPDQTVSITGSTGITVGGSYPNFSLSVADQSATNELQNLSISNDTLSISNGNFVVLPAGGGGVDTATFLQQDSILIYSVAGVEFGRDTIRTAGGSGGGCTIQAVCNQNIEVVLAEDGIGYINVGMVDGGSLGGCDIATIQISDDGSNFGNYFNVTCSDVSPAVNTVYLRVTDINSNTNECSASLSVFDFFPPKIQCKDTVVYIGNSGKVTLQISELYYSGTILDNCNVDSVKIDSAGVLLDSLQFTVNGHYNYQLLAFDPSGNLGICNSFIRVGLNASYIDFDTLYANNYAEGRMKWNVDENSVEIGLSANLSGTALIDDYWYVKNQTGSPIAAGQLVYASGTLGTSGRILVSPYIANGTIDAKYVLGVVAETIPDGEDGYVITKGKLRGINTSAYVDGTVLWASTANAGNLTDTVPQAPNFRLPVAFVVHSATNGILAVRVTTGSDLYEDHRVQVGSPSDGQLLRYDSTDQRWENWTPNFALQDTSGYNNYFAISNDTLRIGDDNDTLFVKLPIVGVSAGSGINVSTVNGIATVTNSAPDQTVVLTAGAGITTSGTYPNFTITAIDTSATNELQTLSISNDTLSISGGNSVVLPPAVLKIRDVTVTTDTIVTADLGKLIRCNNAGAITLRINTNANQPLPIGAVISVEQVGAGVVTITPISGVTINPTARKTWGQYSVIQLIKVGTNTWNVVGGSS
jgi:hypothetical protein